MSDSSTSAADRSTTVGMISSRGTCVGWTAWTGCCCRQEACSCCAPGLDPETCAGIALRVEIDDEDRAPHAASAVARLIAVVVLPTPPFWLATAIIRVLFDMARDAPGQMVRSPSGYHKTIRVGKARMKLLAQIHHLAGSGDLGFGAAPFRNRHRVPGVSCRPRAQKPVERRQCPRGDDRGAEIGKSFDAAVVDLPSARIPGSPSTGTRPCAGPIQQDGTRRCKHRQDEPREAAATADIKQARRAGRDERRSCAESHTCRIQMSGRLFGETRLIRGCHFSTSAT